MIVVFDTNIWKSSLYLRAGAAAAVRFYLHQKGAKVGMPEVVRLEVERHLLSDMLSARAQLSESHQRLLGMVGNLKEVILPDDSTLEAAASGHIDGLAFELIEVPFTLDSARSSLLRTIDKVAPSHTTQQFKDGVIWADCLTLAQADDVTLVTGDRAFYEGNDPTKGLASELLRDTANLPHILKVVSSLAGLLADIREPVGVSDDVLIDAVQQQLGPDISGILDRLAFSTSGAPTLTKSFYATETTNTLFVEFRMDVPCEDASPAGRVDVTLSAVGDGQYDAQAKAFVGLSPTDLSVTYKAADGTMERRRGVYLRAGTGFFGTRTVHHNVRERLVD